MYDIKTYNLSEFYQDQKKLPWDERFTDNLVFLVFCEDRVEFREWSPFNYFQGSPILTTLNTRKFRLRTIYSTDDKLWSIVAPMGLNKFLLEDKCEKKYYIYDVSNDILTTLFIPVRMIPTHNSLNTILEYGDEIIQYDSGKGEDGGKIRHLMFENFHLDYVVDEKEYLGHIVSDSGVHSIYFNPRIVGAQKYVTLPEPDSARAHKFRKLCVVVGSNNSQNPYLARYLGAGIFQFLHRKNLTLSFDVGTDIVPQYETNLLEFRETIIIYDKGFIHIIKPDFITRTVLIKRYRISKHVDGLLHMGIRIVSGRYLVFGTYPSESSKIIIIDLLLMKTYKFRFSEICEFGVPIRVSRLHVRPNSTYLQMKERFLEETYNVLMKICPVELIREITNYL